MRPAEAAPRRILHLAKYYPPALGGMEQFVGDLCRAQARAGHDVRVLAHRDTHGPTVDEEIDGVRVRRMRILGHALYTPLPVSVRRPLVDMIEDAAPDVLHLHLPNVAPFRVLASRRARAVPWVVHWHADVTSSIDRRLDIAYRAYRPWERRVLQRAEAIIATSPPYLESSAPLRPFRGKCHVVPIGIDPARLPPPTPQAELWADQQWPARTPRPLRVLAVGRMTYYKGFDRLLELLPSSPDITAIFAGTGRLEHRLRRSARRLDIRAHARFLGRVDDAQLAALLHTCDVLAMPSIERTEAFGVVLLEAMLHGKPTIASDIPGAGMRWVLDDGACGTLVAPGDIPALADALRALHRDPARRVELGARGRSRVEQAFTIDGVRRAIDAIYDRATDPGRARVSSRDGDGGPRPRASAARPRSSDSNAPPSDTP